MTTKCFAQVRGSVIRATLLDACGNPNMAQSAVVVSKRISSITIDEVTDDGTNIRERGFDGSLQVVDDAYTEVLGYSGVVNFCGVDPGLITLLTGQPLVLDANGDVVGFDAMTGVDLDNFGFALEVWSKLAGQQCTPSGQRQWGYTVFPFFKGGRIGGFSFENGLVQFTVQGAQTRDGNGWGVGPFDVTRNAANAPAPLNTPLAAKAHWRNMMVSLDPPVASCGRFSYAAGSF